MDKETDTETEGAWLGGEGERLIFHILLYSPNACDIHGWIRPKLRAWIIVESSHMCERSPSA